MGQQLSTLIIAYRGRESLNYPPGHPFRKERAGLMLDILKREGVLDDVWCRLAEAPAATLTELRRFHASDYLEALARADTGSLGPEAMAHFGLGSDDCPVFPGVYELAALAVGGSLSCAEEILEGRAAVTFNPFGGFHHAGTAFAEGFCYLNDVVLACDALWRQGKKVACLDLDVHHGNGTQAAFEAEPGVLTISTHESGKTLYPWGGFETEHGKGAGLGYNVNLPLPEGCDDDGFAAVFRQIVLPLLGAYEPDVVVVELGMDVLSGDPLAHLRMTNNAIADACIAVRGLGKPVLALGGGGYNPTATARGWAAALLALCNAEPTDDFSAMVAGVFLGSNEHTSGLRDMRIFATGAERARIDAEVARIIDYHKHATFPLHGLTSKGVWNAL